MGKAGAKGGVRVILKYFEIKKSFSLLYETIYSVIDHRKLQNVARPSVTPSATPRVPLFVLTAF